MHIVQRGNNQQPCFSTDKDYIAFLKWLGEYSHLSKSNIHSYVLMPNHFHLLATPQNEDSISILMKRLGQRYVQYFNRKYTRSGTLWEGRYKSCIVEPKNYLLDCYRYIETHPERAGLVSDPGEYPWSSYRVNGKGEVSATVISHQEYDQLGSTLVEKISAYQRLIKIELEYEFGDELRSATNGNYALGSELFKWEIKKTLGRVVSPGKVGMPKQKT
jgi:putative transposase